MRHANDRRKIGRDGAHSRANVANLLKALILHGRIETTLVKAKVLKRYADRMVTLAKKQDLSARRRAMGKMQIRWNPLAPKEARTARKGNKAAYNDDRRVIEKLFGELGPRFQSRQGGYTRIVKLANRVGDNAKTCVIEYLPGA